MIAYTIYATIIQISIYYLLCLFDSHCLSNIFNMILCGRYLQIKLLLNIDDTLPGKNYLGRI